MAGPAPVAIIMGSQSDWATMRHTAETLDALGVGYEAKIVSAHRTPERLYAFAKGAKQGGHKVIIAGAGGAAGRQRPGAFRHRLGGAPGGLPQTADGLGRRAARRAGMSEAVPALKPD